MICDRLSDSLPAFLIIDREPLPVGQLVPLGIRELVIVPGPLAVEVFVDLFIEVKSGTVSGIG